MVFKWCFHSDRVARNGACAGLVYCTVSYYVHVERIHLFPETLHGEENSRYWLWVSVLSRKERREKKIVWKRSLCGFVSSAAFQVYFCERGKGHLFAPQNRWSRTHVINEDSLFLIFNPKYACFLHPFCDCLLRSKDLCCRRCQIILRILFEFFGWSEFLASFLAMKRLTS